jgi:hypothetical protein
MHEDNITTQPSLLKQVSERFKRGPESQIKQNKQSFSSVDKHTISKINKSKSNYFISNNHRPGFW